MITFLPDSAFCFQNGAGAGGVRGHLYGPGRGVLGYVEGNGDVRGVVCERTVCVERKEVRESAYECVCVCGK